MKVQPKLVNNNQLVLSYRSEFIGKSTVMSSKRIGKVSHSKAGFGLAIHRIMKRSIDLIISSTLIVFLLSWLMPIIALLIKIDSKGPVFFIQKRTGKNKKTFQCVKFRTMLVNENSNRIQTQIDDPRVTPIGRFLRRTFIDELPQLFNVFIGNMSLIGPRPHMLRHSVEFSQLISNYHQRHHVKPGLTGLAQIQGYHGYIHNFDDLYYRVYYDLEYISGWNIFTDIQVFIKTFQHVIKIVFKSKLGFIGSRRNLKVS